MKAESSNEWYLCYNKTDTLKTITQNLDKANTSVETKVNGKDVDVDVKEFGTDTEATKWFLKGFGLDN